MPLELQGTGFIGVHQLLDETYDRLTEAFDTVAERILGGKANGILAYCWRFYFRNYSTDITKASSMFVRINRYKTIAASLREGIDTAGDAGDEDTADLLIS